jgi:DNA-binding MarR family transcriptional regulator
MTCSLENEETMGPTLEKAIHDLSLRMRLMRAVQEDQAGADALSERETLILQQVAEQGPVSISQIAECWPNLSDSTISMTVTGLWRNRGLVTKTINPDNQRVTLVELSDKGRVELDKAMQQRRERFQALFDAMNVSDEEKQVLIRVCQRGVTYLDTLLGMDKSDAAANH